jgi:serine protease Do
MAFTGADSMQGMVMRVLRVVRRRDGASMFQRLAVMAVIGLAWVTAAHAASLDPAVLPKIQAATF